MSFAARIGALEPTRRGTPCKTCIVLAKLDGEDAAALRSVLAVGQDQPGRLSAQDIADFLVDDGYDTSETSVSNHRRQRHV